MGRRYSSKGWCAQFISGSALLALGAHLRQHNEQVGIQIEEPFSILPLEAFCNGAIEATNKEMLGAVQKGVFEREMEH